MRIEPTWVCLTQLLPLSRFLTSSGVCVSRTLAALFHAAATHRVSHLQSVSHVESRNRLRSVTLMTLQDGLICDRAWASPQPKSQLGQTLSNTSRCLRPPGQAARRLDSDPKASDLTTLHPNRTQSHRDPETPLNQSMVDSELMCLTNPISSPHLQ